MNSTRKGLLLATGIISILTIIGFLIAGAAFAIIANMPDLAAEIAASSDPQTTAEVIMLVFSILAGVFIFMAAMNIIVAVIAFRNAGRSEAELGRGALIGATVIAFLFSGYLQAVFLVIALILKDTTPQVAGAQSRETAQQEIENVRALYAKGAITKEEYDALIKDLFSKINL